MFTFEDTIRTGRRMARRPFLKVGASLGGLAASGLLGGLGRGLSVAEAATIRLLASDRSVIFLFMHGVPSQFETFDPKRDGPAHARSVTGEIATSVPGVFFGSTFEKLAARAHLFNVVRSFVTGDGSHDIKPVVGRATTGANMGSLYARATGVLRADTAMPTNVAVFPQAVDAEAGPAITDFGNFESAGEFGGSYAPLVPGGAGPFLDNLRLHLPQQRLGDRRSLLASLDRGRRWLDQLGVRTMLDGQDLAFDVLGRSVADAFSLDGEDASSPQSVGGPWAGETDGSSRGSPGWVRIFRIVPGSVMNAISRMSPPHAGHSSGNSSPTRAISFAHAIREVSCDPGFA